jgi:hypothetical protein
VKRYAVIRVRRAGLVPRYVKPMPDEILFESDDVAELARWYACNREPGENVVMRRRLLSGKCVELGQADRAIVHVEIERNK